MRGSKSKYSPKQKRQAKHIAQSYRKKSVSGKESAKRAWATVNKSTGGGQKGGSGSNKSSRELAGRRKSVSRSAAATRKGRALSLSERGRLGGLASGRSRRSTSSRSKTAAKTRTKARSLSSTSRRSTTSPRSKSSKGISRRMSNVSRGRSISSRKSTGKRSMSNRRGLSSKGMGSTRTTSRTTKRSASIRNKSSRRR